MSKKSAPFDTTVQERARWFGRRLATVAAIGLVLSALQLVGSIAPADAHGAATRPGSRTYLCRLDGTHSSGDIQPHNPACAQAVAIGGKQPLWDWFGVLRGDGAGRTRGYIPDGQLCSGGEPKFAGYDQARSDWPYTSLTAGAELSIRYNAWAAHPGEFRLYVTKDGFDPNRPLRWDDLEDEPFSTYQQNSPNGTDAKNNTPDYQWTARLPNKTGQHIIYSVWERSDSNETFYGCSDVRFDGGSGQVVGVGPGGAAGSTASDGTPASTSASSDTPAPSTTVAPTTAAPGTIGTATNEPTVPVGGNTVPPAGAAAARGVGPVDGQQAVGGSGIAVTNDGSVAGATAQTSNQPPAIAADGSATQAGGAVVDSSSADVAAQATAVAVGRTLPASSAEDGRLTALQVQSPAIAEVGDGDGDGALSSQPSQQQDSTAPGSRSIMGVLIGVVIGLGLGIVVSATAFKARREWQSLVAAQPVQLPSPPTVAKGPPEPRPRNRWSSEELRTGSAVAGGGSNMNGS